MRVLVACEFSGIVREAFRKKGHDAWSCDFLPTDQPGNHLQCDVRDVLGDGWDLMIAHPPCTYLCVSGLHWNKRRPGREKKTEEALEFVRSLLDAPIDMIAVENPVGCISTRIRKPDQTIQPWWFGEDASKATCLWLKNLPPLRPTNVISKPAWVRCDCCEDFLCTIHGGHVYDCKCKPIEWWVKKDIDPYTSGGRYANQTPGGQNKLGPSPDRWKLRSLTYPGIAEAMAEQWTTGATLFAGV
jgi:hypothetical protein